MRIQYWIKKLDDWLDVRSNDPETRRRGRLLNIVLAALFVGGWLDVGRVWYRAQPFWPPLVLIATTTLAYALNRRGRTSIAGHLLIWLLLALDLTSPGLREYGFTILLTIPILLAGMVLGPNWGLLYGFGIVVVALIVRMFVRPVVISLGEVGLLVVNVLLIGLFSSGIDRAIRTLSLRTVELEQANAALAAREKLREIFGRFVSPQVAQSALQRGVNLGGEVITASVLFTDIRDFTGLAERLAPDHVVALLNRFFCVTVPVIGLNNGLVVEFGGDSILAVFGTPVLPAEDHAVRAVRCALGLRRALAEFNEKQKAAGEPTLSIGIGVSTGAVVAGHIGCEERLEYTVIGDNVNLASRLQQLTREWGDDIVISEATYHAAHGQIAARPVNDVLIRGRKQAITAYVVEAQA